MPKKVWKIDKFHGGINNVSDPKDLADDELVNCTGMTVHNIGRLSMMGGVSADIIAHEHVIQPGYGLFYFKHDRKIDSLLITTTGGHGRSVGDWVGNTADFTAVATSVGYVYEVPSTTTLIISKHKTQSNVWSINDDLFYSNDDPKSFTDTDAADTGVNLHGSTVPTIATPETGEDYILLAASGGNCGATSYAPAIYRYDKTATVWRTAFTFPTVEGTSSTSNLVKGVFFQIDGAVRVASADFTSRNASGDIPNTGNKWYGYIKRTHFNGLEPGGSVDTYDEWTAVYNEIAAPTRGLAGILDGTGDGSHATNLTHDDFWLAAWETEIDTGEYLVANTAEDLSLGITSYTTVHVVVTATADDWDTDPFGVFTDAGTGFNLDIIAPSGTDGELVAGTYEFGTTFIYDAEPGESGAQESVIYTLAGTSAVTEAQSWGAIQVYCTSPYSARITGGIVYTRIQDSGDSWSQIMEISLKNGVRRNDTESYQSWSLYDDDADAISIHVVSTALKITELQPFTYTLNTQRPESITTLYARYKTAVVMNRRVYIGNVIYDGIRYGDMMIRTPVDQPDVYSISNSVEISTRDGDEIIKLEEYADRILQFKKNKMHIYNVSQDIEFLEDTFMHKGISSPSAVCKTDFGIAWANEVGCYLYDGEKVHNLLEKDGKPMIRITPLSWSSFMGTTPQVGYIPKFRQLLVQASAASNGACHIYDFRTRSWAHTFNMGVTGKKETNYIVNWNNDLIFSHTSCTGTFVKWQTADSNNDGIASTQLSVITKQYDFGHPGIKKKIYKVYLTYRGDGSGVVIKYDINGEPEVAGEVGSYHFNRITSLTDPSSSVTGDITPLLDASGTAQIAAGMGSGLLRWIRAELKPVTSSEANNVDTFGLSFSGSPAKDFEINDINIVYRLKNIK